jgi:hypothetical protein
MMGRKGVTGRGFFGILRPFLKGLGRNLGREVGSDVLQ